MASGSQSMTTYYAKRIVGDASAAQANSALLQTGTNVTADTWILNRTNRATTYGIKYVYDTTTTTVHNDENNEDITTNNGQDKIEFYGGSATASAWVQLDTGDILVNNIDSYGNINLYFANGIGIGLTNNGHIESTQANDYRKGVYFTDTNGNLVSWHESYIMENRTNTMFESANLVNDTLVYGGMQIQIHNSGESYISLLMTHASSNGSSRMIDMCHYTDNTNEILLNADTKPRTTNVYNLGSESRMWKDAYIYNLNIGIRETTTAPTELIASNRIIITPYYHTGGPWYIKSMDDNTNAYIALYYGASELLRIKHEGTFQADIKANITGNAATATKLSNTPNNTTSFLRGDNTWSNTLTGTFYSSGSPGFQNVTTAGTWAYLQLKSGTLGWDIASNSSQNSGALDFRPHKSTNHGIMISQDGGLYFRNPATEGIYYAGTKATHRMIRFIDNASDTYGNGIGIGGGGLVVIGAGESSDTLLSNLSLTSSGGTETTYITSDGSIEFYPSINGWDATARIWMTAGVLNIGLDGNSPRENSLNVYGGAGRIQLYSASSTTGNRGLWVPAHGSGSAKNIILIDTNNNITFNGNVTGNCSGSSGSCTGNAATATNADKVDNYHAADLWRKDGGTWNGNANIACTPTANNQEYSFDLGNAYTGTYWHVWSGKNSKSILVCYNDNMNVSVPNGTLSAKAFSGPLTGNVTGNCSGSAGSVAWANTGHPSTFPPSAHTHTWLELAPGNKAATTGAAQSDDTGPFTVRWYSATGKIAQQPSQYGFLITCATGKGSAEQHALWLEQNNGHIYHRGTNGGNSASPPAFKKLWEQGDAVTSAVWNDYAEARAAQGQPGQVVYELGDDTCAPTTKRLQHFAGIVSDTWGFSQGETDAAKTPIAVAGRVLAYPYRNRNEYKPGDVLCAAPGGTVDIMTRKEVIQYPDRIVGTVSCVPNYEEWGGGKGADRSSVQVNGRIWVKVK